MVPVIQRWVEWKLFALVRWDLVPYLRDVARVEDAVDLGVDAVELDEVDSTFQAFALPVEVIGHLCHIGPERQSLDDPLRRFYEAQGRAGLGRQLATSRIRPRRRADRLAVSIAQRVVSEVTPGRLLDLAEPQRIPRAGRRVVHARRVRGRRIRSDRQHRVDDEIRRDDVEQRVRKAREVLQDAATEGQDQRFRHSEAFEPSGERFGQRAFDDRGPNNRKRDVAMELHDRMLCHRLRERVDVREPHGIRMHAAPLDELVLHPPIAQPLGRARDSRRPGRTHLRAGLATQLLQDLRTSRLLLHDRTKVRENCRFMAPVQAWIVRSLFPDESPKHPAHIGGRDVDEVRPVAGGLQRLHHPRRAEQVGLRGEVRRVVKLDRGGRMDDDLARPQLLTACFSETKPIAAEVELKDLELLLDQLRESVLTKLLSQTLEGRAGKHLALQPLGGGPASARTNRQVDLADLGDRAQALFDYRLAQEAGRAGDQDGLTPEGLSYQDRLILVSGRKRLTAAYGCR